MNHEIETLGNCEPDVPELTRDPNEDDTKSDIMPQQAARAFSSLRASLRQITQVSFEKSRPDLSW